MKKVGFLKRILVAMYDGLLLTAVVFFSLALVMAVFIAIAPPSFFIDSSLLENPKIGRFNHIHHSLLRCQFLFLWLVLDSWRSNLRHASLEPLPYQT